MLVSISIVRYILLFIPLAVLAMAIHRIPLSLNKACTFWNLMGCDKNGSFDLKPDVEPVAEIMTKAWGLSLLLEEEPINGYTRLKKFNKI